ncbi:MAG: hypothetical protein PHY80_04440 [Rickettsiales bacterium]|nr:hypothetical protein [Rickettsiales bacterium]
MGEATKVDLAGPRDSAQTRGDLDLDTNASHHTVDGVDVHSQEGVDSVKVKKQKQQEGPDAVQAKENKDGKSSRTSRILWYGIFLTCGLLMVPVVPGTAFLILPMQVAGFAMIPLNKRETKNIMGDRKPRDFLLTPEEDPSDTILHGTKKAAGEQLEQTGSATVSGSEIPVEFGATISGESVKMVSATELREFLNGQDIDINSEKLNGDLEGKEQISAEQIHELCATLALGEHDPRRTLLEGLAENIEVGRGLSGVRVSETKSATKIPSVIPISGRTL